MDIEYVAGDFFSSIYVANVVLRNWSIRSIIVRGGNMIKSLVGGVVILANWVKHFVKVCEYLSQYFRILYLLFTS